MAGIYISNSALGMTRRILSDQVSIAGTKNNDVTPNANGINLSKVQTQSFENPKINISNIRITNASGTLTYEDILELYDYKYTGTNHNVLTITYGARIVPSLATSTSGIKVILSSFNIRFDTKDSKDAYLPSMDLVFTETL
jgi:hypothetical protein